VPRPQLPVGTVCDLPVTHSQPNMLGSCIRLSMRLRVIMMMLLNMF